MPKIPNGSAAPFFSTHCATKKVHAKETIDRRIVMITKQSAARDA